MEMCYIIYGREDAKFFEETWVPMIHIHATKGTILNWEDVIESSLKTCVRRAKTPTEG